MKIGTEKNNTLLKVAIAVCVFFSLSHLFSFIYSHIPPYKPGQCLVVAKNPYIDIKIDDNNVPGGYSDVTLSFLGEEKKGPVSFTELRETELKESECSK